MKARAAMAAGSFALRRRLSPATFGPDQGPIVVGGVGGSGTRVVADIMRRLGVYTGADLNRAGDNKWFTLLCKLPRWDLDELSADAARITCSFDLLERAMTGKLAPAGADGRAIADIVARCIAWSARGDLPDDRSPEWLHDRAKSLRRSWRCVPATAALWGWKEPNSHLFLPQLQSHFGSRLRYVHVIRNGAYMAHSRNKAQVMRWGQQLGVADAATATPAATLDYWITSNELAITRGAAMPEGSFLLVNHDELCAAPREGIARFIRFLSIDPPAAVMDELVELPSAPKPLPQSAQELQLEFGAARLERVRALGFPV